PTFFENFAEGFVRGNPELAPERSRNREIGIEQAFLDGRGIIGATYFHQRFRNLIQFTSQPPAPGDPNFFNVGIATASGVELTGSITTGALDFSGSYSYLDTEVIDEGYGTDQQFLEGRRLLRRPQHHISFGGNYAIADRARLGATIDHVGKRDDLDFSDPIQFAGIRIGLPAYTTVDFSGQYELLARGTSRITITASVQNALNEKYEEIKNFPSPGRSVLIGIRSGIGL
ncbi:MAG: TonB-dependent receptor domain-containing protein, partial [Longimicrobiales bacterium]